MYPPDYVSPLRRDPHLAITPREVKRIRAERIFNQWIRGASYEELALRHGMTTDGIRTVLGTWVSILWRVHKQWRQAEMRCRALAMELRYLRVGQDCPDDQPLEALNPPAQWLRAFKYAKVETVNQLRSVRAEELLELRIYETRRRFPRDAIDWAIFKMDRLGISHALKIPRRQVTVFDKRGLRRKARPAESGGPR